MLIINKWKKWDSKRNETLKIWMVMIIIKHLQINQNYVLNNS